MALPRLNDVPKYTLKIPSTNKEITYRPFLVKEQKVLLMALESQDDKQILQAVLDTIEACVLDKINATNLALFDLEYVFLKIRSVSVGEGAEVTIKCQKCENPVKTKIDLNSITFDKMPENRIKINDKYTIQMMYPTFNTTISGVSNSTLAEQVYIAALGCLDKLLTNDEVIDFKDETEEEKRAFLESLTALQFESIIEFVNNLPRLRKEVEYKCEECNTTNKTTLEGLQDFLS
tara:strand:- start:421 stop:1122 length:702 start_codon:yes stop_codon:yes gene_type:complete